MSTARDSMAPRLLSELTQRGADAPFVARVRRHLPDFLEGARPVYGDRDGFDAWVADVLDTAAAHHDARATDLRTLDLEREGEPDWFQSPRHLGYALYVDRFAGSLRGVVERLDYLEELGVTYVHLMPFAKCRPGENDGGYAVADYEEVEPSLGTREDLADLATALRRRGISLCTDLVLNHVAREHPWAVAARAGEARYQGYFHLFPDRSLPDRYEEALPQIFPASAPGSFSHEPALDRWVWTTFHGYQWDLDWSNPQVFHELLRVILGYANLGVDVFRLDAVAFLWKRLGTSCQNQPEVHCLVQALRAVTRMVAPAVIFKAEAIVGPDHLVEYLGTGPHRGKISSLAYHNSLMAHLWSALAARDARLMTHALERLPPKPEDAAWVTYLRCHDDIGWAIADEDAAAAGLSGPAHRAFLAEYYRGSFPGSHALGADFQPDAATGDRRTCGMTASLSGLELALEGDDPRWVGLSIERILLAHAILFAFPGLPVLYMGDEIGLRNDRAYDRDPRRAADPRWLHRPPMDWQAAGRRHVAGSVEARIFHGLAHLLRARRESPELHAAAPFEVLASGAASVLAFARLRQGRRLVAVFNVSEAPQAMRAPEERLDRITGDPVEVRRGELRLPPYARLWLVGADG